ncbi:MAG: hypothetical protein HN348_35120, partial [Proteobacteria bacterium]|nr:hypothetical protein [Pseudomonadota bacterium]
MRSLALAIILGLSASGCKSESKDTDSNDTDVDTDDTDVDTDDTDTDADTGIIGEVDDDTCDNGATAATAMHFIFSDTNDVPIVGATWAIRDLDANTGALSDVVTSGTTTSKGFDATLDCADGWMLLEVSHDDYLDLHAYFLVYPVDDWTLAAMAESLAAYAINTSITSPKTGLLAAYKFDMGNADLQGDDVFRINDGPNLVPPKASDNIGMWIFDGAFTSEMFSIWFVGGAVPGSEQVAKMKFVDQSEGTVTMINAP